MPEVGYSMVKTYRRCPKSYEYRYVRNLQRVKPAVPLIRGTIIHEMLDARAIKSDPKSILAKYEERYGTLFREEREIYGENFLEEIRRIYRGYEREYNRQDVKYIASEEFIATDLTPRIRYTAHLDKVIETQNRLWVMDHKTHKNIPTEEQRFQDYQILMYIWARNRERSEKVDGLIWDYIRTKPPTIPEQLKSGQLTTRQNLDTDHYTYLKTLLSLDLDPKPYRSYLEQLKQRSKGRFYQRVFLPAPAKAMVDRVVKDFTETAVIMHGIRRFPRTMTYNCSWCEYYRLCSAELRGLDAKFIEKTEYKEEEIGHQEDQSEE